jgi:tRNA A-37 threonylcarbamoyl transferase component Bud32
MAIFRKTVGRREMELSLMMSALDIGPQIFSVRPVPPNRYILEMQKYPMTLEDYKDKGGQVRDFAEAIDALIDQMHDLGLIHGDLHSNNIVLNPDSREVRLIDFERTQYLNEVDFRQISHFWDVESAYTRSDEILDHEYQMYRF